MKKFILSLFFITCFLGKAFGKSLIIDSEESITKQELSPISKEVFGLPSNIYDCLSNDNKQLLVSQVIDKDAAFLGYVTYVFNYFPTAPTDNRVINCVTALDISGGNTGSYAVITGGGVGYKNVEITLRSKWSRGLKYLVNVYSTQ